MAEHVRSVDLGVRWSPGAPCAHLSVNDEGDARLRLNPHIDDSDQRPVELVWEGAIATRMEPPNDEAIDGHRLYDAGLSEVHWLGEVHESDVLADLERRNRVHPHHSADLFADMRHWVVPLKECVVEVVARSLRVERAER